MRWSEPVGVAEQRELDVVESAPRLTRLEQFGLDQPGGALREAVVIRIPDAADRRHGVDFGEAFSSRDAYLETAFTFENLGVSAYLGAAGFIKEKAILQAAAGIFGVEARHAAVIGNLLGKPAENGVYMGATETPLSKDEVLAAAQPFLTGAAGMGDGAAATY